MKISYTPESDSLYIYFTDQSILTTRRVNDTIALDFDEAGNIVGIEVLNAQRSGIDPLSIEIKHGQHKSETERPDQAALRAARTTRMEKIKQKRQQTETVE